MDDRTADEPSGIKIGSGPDGARDLTWAELASMADVVSIHPDIFLDVQSEMVGVQYDAAAFDQVRRHFLEACRERDLRDENGEPLINLDPARLNMVVITLTLRLQAADELSGRDWMKQVWLEGMGHDDVLPLMAEHFTSAPLVFSPELGGLVFNEKDARMSLEPLLRGREDRGPD